MARLLGEDVQDVHESVVRSINWAPDLNGATISSVSWDTGGLTNDAASATSTVASVRLSGGVPGRRYVVTCRVTSSASETLEAEIVLTIDN